MCTDLAGLAAEYGRNLTLIRYPSFTRLVLVGLPNRLRGEIWELTCGSMFLRLGNPGRYAQILRDHEGRRSSSTDDIEKDLHRSCVASLPLDLVFLRLPMLSVSRADLSSRFRRSQPSRVPRLPGRQGHRYDAARPDGLLVEQPCARLLPGALELPLGIGLRPLVRSGPC